MLSGHDFPSLGKLFYQNRSRLPPGAVYFFACLCILLDSSVCSGLDQRRSAPDPAPADHFGSLFFRHSAQSGHTVFECCRTVRQHPAPFELSQFATTLFFARPNFGLALYTMHRCPNFGRWLPSSQIAKTVRACCAVVHIVDNCETGFRFVTPFCARIPLEVPLTVNDSFILTSSRTYASAFLNVCKPPAGASRLLCGSDTANTAQPCTGHFNASKHCRG